MGMLGTAAYILAMDTFGPITDNAGGIVEMSRQPEEIRKKTDRLDAVGNTTQGADEGLRDRLGGARGVPASSPRTWTSCRTTAPRWTRVNLAKPEVFLGGLLGAMLVFFFSGLAIQAVGKAAARRHPGRAGAVQRAPGHHAGHGEARLRPHGGHRHARSAPADDRARARGGRHADRRRPRLQALRRRRRGRGRRS